MTVPRKFVKGQHTHRKSLRPLHSELQLTNEQHAMGRARSSWTEKVLEVSQRRRYLGWPSTGHGTEEH